MNAIKAFHMQNDYLLRCYTFFPFFERHIQGTRCYKNIFESYFKFPFSEILYEDLCRRERA